MTTLLSSISSWGWSMRGDVKGIEWMGTWEGGETQGPWKPRQSSVGSSHSWRLRAQVIQDLKCVGLVGEQPFRTCWSLLGKERNLGLTLGRYLPRVLLPVRAGQGWGLFFPEGRFPAPFRA